MNPESRPSLNPKRVKHDKNHYIPVLPLIRMAMGIRLRADTDMEYALAVVAEADPGINFIGENGDRIFANQREQVLEAVRTARRRWINLIPPDVDTEELLERAERSNLDWNR